MPVFDPYLKFYSAQAPQVLGPSQYTLGWFYEVYAPRGSNQGGGERDLAAYRRAAWLQC